ncbi:exodeoxyribonuclease VII small subunit [Alkalicella caledoniensis]|uniref:Exodeoxyribonuclease 7 small subunit n=1 Tax=Alkalicella caledoniensis TaxID=2731377 RepID=A0A7G9WDH1_ALKCA|nr:exodeoxyribonuclease VII small subunit [Alkalicella caledoniensis]
MVEKRFEEAYNQLQDIVRKLEEGNLDLEDALSQFEEGMSLLSICKEKIKTAEQKIEELTEKNC